MRYLILSDIHANLEALEKCMELAEGKYGEVLCLGDLVGYGPDPNRVIETVRPMAKIIIRGNHDKACAGITTGDDFNLYARLATQWTRDQLTPENFAFLRDLPAGPVYVNGLALVHGSPADEDEYILGPSQALPNLRNPLTQVVLFGHTHYQGGFMLTSNSRYQSIRPGAPGDGLTFTLQFEEGARYLVNPGSIGQPRDGDPRAAFAILDEEQRQVEYYRTPYDIAKTQKKMERACLPEPLIRRLEFGR
ncbi:MAG: metallophosphoesterase family protein [Acidobacteria bacterium]|nr:metallophosphoesterase family protein [Acidobacteriota bacterium]